MAVKPGAAALATAVPRLKKPPSYEQERQKQRPCLWNGSYLWVGTLLRILGDAVHET